MLIFIKKLLFSKKKPYRIFRALFKKVTYLLFLYWMESRSLKKRVKNQSQESELQGKRVENVFTRFSKLIRLKFRDVRVRK